jgi:hypothetical protein
MGLCTIWKCKWERLNFSVLALLLGEGKEKKRVGGKRCYLEIRGVEKKRYDRAIGLASCFAQQSLRPKEQSERSLSSSRKKEWRVNVKFYRSSKGKEISIGLVETVSVRYGLHGFYAPHDRHCDRKDDAIDLMIEERLDRRERRGRGCLTVLYQSLISRIGQFRE